MSSRGGAVNFGPDPSMEDIQSVLEHDSITYKALSEKVWPYLELAETGLFEDDFDHPYKTLTDLKTSVVKAFEYIPEVDVENLPAPALELQSIIQRLHIPQLLEELIDTIKIKPELIFEKLDKQVMSVFITVALILRDLHGNSSFLRWVVRLIAPPNWHNRPSTVNSLVRFCGVASKKAGLFRSDTPLWVIQTSDGVMNLYTMNCPTEPIKLIRPIIKEVSECSVTIKSTPRKETKFMFDCQSSAQTFHRQMLVPPPFPLMLCPFPCPYPDILVDAFLDSLLSPDTQVLRAIVVPKVMRITDCRTMMPHLFRVFSSCGKVHRLISTIAGMEFSDPKLTQNTLLRANSHLTSLFRYYWETFGYNYYVKVIRPIVEAVDEAGELDLRNPRPDQVKTLAKLLLMGLKKICGSSKHIPKQMRHMAYVLKMSMFTHFKSRRSVYNALCGFFCLRFVTVLVIDPLQIEPDIKLKSDPSKTLIPYAQLLQIILNLQTLNDKYQFRHKEEQALRAILGDIFNFVHDLPYWEGDTVEYPQASEDEVRTSTIEMMDLIHQRREHFIESYNSLSSNDGGVSPVAWRVAELIISCFD